MHPETRKIIDEYVRFNKARRDLATSTIAFANWISANRPELFIFVTEKDANVTSETFNSWFDGLSVTKRNSILARGDDFCDNNGSFCTKLESALESYNSLSNKVQRATPIVIDDAEQQSEKTIRIAEDASVDIVDALVRCIEEMNVKYSNDDRHAAIVIMTDLMQQLDKCDTRANELVVKALSMGQTVLSRLCALE
jgi:hypothetical protein